MKKLVLLLSVFALVFTSCGSDDDGDSQDSFIGNWKYSQYFEDGVEIPLEDCEELVSIIVLSDGTYSTTSYWDNGNDCVLDYISNGTWENLGAGVYTSTDQDGDTFVQEIGFSGNTMYYEETEDGVVYKDVFVRQ